MKNLSRQFWNGFAINVFAAAIFTVVFNYLAYDKLMILTDRDLMIIMYLIQYVFWGALVFVFISALLFTRARTLSVWLMSIGSLPLLPVGALLLNGIFRANNQVRFTLFSSLTKKDKKEWETLALFNTDKILLTSTAVLVPSLSQAYLSGSLIGIVTGSIAAIYLFNAIRLNKCPVLAWAADEVAITPNLFSDTLIIPANLIENVSLVENQLIIDIKINERIASVNLKKSQFKNTVLEEMAQKFTQYLQSID